MGRPFRHRRRGVEVRLKAPERALLAQLLRQLDTLLDDGRPITDDPMAELAALELLARSQDGPEPATEGPPDDPALARLLPDAHRDDPELAGEFRRLTEQGLRSRKRSNALVAAEALGRHEPVLLTEDEARSMVKALTDLRLVLAERLGLQTDSDAELLHARLASQESFDAAWTAAAATYDALTWWQECLVGAITRRS
jgi:hypothetical protein